MRYEVLGKFSLPSRTVLTKKPAFESVVQMMTEGQNISILAGDDDPAWSSNVGDESAEALPVNALGVEIIFDPSRHNRDAVSCRPDIRGRHRERTILRLKDHTHHAILTALWAGREWMMMSLLCR